MSHTATDAATAVNVVVVDDHPMIREGLRSQLDRTHDINVVATAGSVAEALLVLAGNPADVVLVDHQLEDGFGLELVRHLAGAPIGVILVSAYEDRGLVNQYITAGAAGFLHKTAGPDSLAATVRAAAVGIDATDSQSMNRSALAGVDSTAELSPRELEVLRWAARGLTNGAVGSQLGISGQTVKTHLSRAYAKLGVGDRAHAVSVAQGRGLI